MIRRVPLWLALIMAASGGFLMRLSFPEPNVWLLIFPALLLQLWALIGRRVWSSLLVGFVSAIAFWAPLIFWLTVYLGPIPWLGLVSVMVAWMTLAAVGIGLLLNRLRQRVLLAAWQRVLIIPLGVAGLWTAREGISGSWPWGGFSWGRIAESQAQSPFSHDIAWLGMAGLSFVLVWIVSLILEVGRQAPASWWWSLPVSLLALLLALPTWSAANSGTVRVAAVQGNSKSGLFDVHAPGDTLQDHIQASEGIGDQPIDMIVWPENAADISPLTDNNAAAALTYVSERYNAPIVTGAITEDFLGQLFNSSLVWTKDSVTAQYDKIHPVPFAEWMPARDFFHALVPDLVDMVTRDYVFGSRPNVVDVGGVAAGISICFDIVDDAQIRQMAADGAQLVLAQTNNADFGKTDESLQQIAIAQLRAIEMGRSVVNISTVGASAIFNPDGSTVATLPRFTAGVMVDDVSLNNGQTPAMAWGFALEIVVSAFGLLCLATALFWPKARQRGRQSRP